MSLYPEGAVLTLKKSHPCGSREWRVLRAGWEYRLQCAGCHHVMLMRRDQLHKLVRSVGAVAGETKPQEQTPQAEQQTQPGQSAQTEQQTQPQDR